MLNIAPPNPPMDLSIIVPAYKSKDILKEQLPVLTGWIRNWNIETEIIIVADGEDINLYKQLEVHPLVKVTGYIPNQGKGYAIKEGFRLSTAPIIIYTDADIPFTEESMLRMVKELQQHKGEDYWVIGDRTLPGSVYYEDIPWLRKKGSDFFLVIIKYTLGKSFNDTQCGLKGFTRHAGAEVFKRSIVNRFAFDFECLFIARQHSIEVKQIPVQLRNQSPSTVRIWQDGFQLLRDVFKILSKNKY